MNAMIGRAIGESDPLHRPDADPATELTARRVARVTEGQRACLRLVLEHKTSKDIAIVLGVSPETVDKRLKTAARILDVQGRVAAALLVRDHEEIPSGYQRLVYRSPDLVEVPFLSEECAAHSEWSRTDEPLLSSELRDVSAPEWLAADLCPDPAVHGPDRTVQGVPVPWGSSNRLGVPQRLALIVVIAGLSAIAFGSIISSFEALRRLL